MPCYDSRNDPGVIYKERCDELTRLLCMACQNLGAFRPEDLGSPELNSWWAKHEEADRIRLESERAEADDARNRRIAKLKNELNGMEARVAAYSAELAKIEGEV